MYLIVVVVDASSAAPSVAEDGRVLLAIWDLVHAVLDAGTHCNHDKAVNAAETGQRSRGYQRAAGTAGGSRQVGRQLW